MKKVSLHIKSGTLFLLTAISLSHVGCTSNSKVAEEVPIHLTILRSGELVVDRHLASGRTIAYNIHEDFDKVTKAVREDIQRDGGWSDRSVQDNGLFFKRWPKGRVARASIMVMPMKLDRDLVGVGKVFDGWSSVIIKLSLR